MNTLRLIHRLGVMVPRSSTRWQATLVLMIGLASSLHAADFRETWSDWFEDLSTSDSPIIILPADHDTGGLLLRSEDDFTFFPAPLLPRLSTLSLSVTFDEIAPPPFPPEALLLLDSTTSFAPTLTASDDTLTYTWDISALPASPENLEIIWQSHENLSIDRFTLLQSASETNLASLLIDTDGNGIDDAWELAHFDRIGIDPTADPDGDGLTNFAEYLAGTDPNVAAASILPTSLNLIVYSP